MAIGRVRDVSRASELKVLASDTRLKILLAAMFEPEREWSTQELADAVGIFRVNIYHHLAPLVHEGFLIATPARLSLFDVDENTYRAAQTGIRFLLGQTDEPKTPNRGRSRRADKAATGNNR